MLLPNSRAGLRELEARGWAQSETIAVKNETIATEVTYGAHRLGDAQAQALDEIQSSQKFLNRSGDQVGVPHRVHDILVAKVVPKALGGTAMLDITANGIRWSLKAVDE